jgi:hypothetical protein
VKAVGLCVERDPWSGAEFWEQPGEFFVGVNQATIFNRKGATAQKFFGKSLPTTFDFRLIPA